MSTPLALALSMMVGTILAPSSSNREAPMSMPSTTFLKVKAMPPPMTMESTRSSMLSISWILSDTLAPPMMARNGRSGLSRALLK